MQYFSCGSDKCTEIIMCDLEPFSKIQSNINTVWLEVYVRYIPVKPFEYGFSDIEISGCHKIHRFHYSC